MNTLQELNSRQSTTTFTDERPASITFDRAAGSTRTTNIEEGHTFTHSVGIEILEIINYQTINASYTIDASACPGTVVQWDSIPAGLTLTNPSDGVYTISGIRWSQDWAAIRAPRIRQPVEYSGSYVITSTINYSGNQSKSWLLNVNVANIVELSSATDFWFTPGTFSVTGPTKFIDTAGTGWSLTVSASPNNNVTSISAGGSGVYNPVSKTLTLTGTNAQINTALNSLSMVTTATIPDNMVLTYTAYYAVGDYFDTQRQNLKNTANRYLSPVSAGTYNEDQAGAVGNAPIITHPEYAGTAAYTMTVAVNSADLAKVKLLDSAGSGGSKSWNATTRTLTITGTKTQVNSHLATLTLTPTTDVESNFSLIYTVTVPAGTYISPGLLSKTQVFYVNQTHDEASNYFFARNFNATGNSIVGTAIFAQNTIQITDQDTSNPTYTVELSLPNSTYGYWTTASTGGPGFSTLSFSGTRAYCNILLTKITLWMNAGRWANTYFTYKQYKNSVLQLTYSPQLFGPDVAFSGSWEDETNPQLVSTTEGATHYVPVASGKDIVGVNDPSTTLPVTYTIDIRNIPGAIISWPDDSGANVLGGLVTQPVLGMYRVSMTNPTVQWAAARLAVVALPNSFNGSVTYTVATEWNNFANRIDWDVNLTVADVAPFTSTSQFTYTIGVADQLIQGKPQLVDTGSQSINWTVTVRPNRLIAGLVLTASAAQGSFNWNSTTQTASISGSVSAVNARLAALSISSRAGQGMTFDLIYTASNLVNSETGVILQRLVAAASTSVILSPTRANSTYIANTTTNIANGPLFSSASPLSPLYAKLEVSGYPTNAVGLLGYNKPASTSQHSAYIGYNMFASGSVIRNDGAFVAYSEATAGNGWVFFRVKNASDWVVGDDTHTEPVNQSTTIIPPINETVSGVSITNSNCRFGISLAANAAASVLFIGEDNGVGTTDSSRCGAVSIYSRTNLTASRIARISNNVALSQFGKKVEVSEDGNKLVILSNQNMYIYSGSAGSWTLTNTIAGAFGDIRVNYDGSIVAATIGAVVYIYTNGSLTTQFTNGTLTTGQSLSISLSSNGARLAVGNAFDSNRGKVFYYTSVGGWSLKSTLVNAQGVAGDRFGFGVEFGFNAATLYVLDPTKAECTIYNISANTPFWTTDTTKLIVDNGGVSLPTGANAMYNIRVNQTHIMISPKPTDDSVPAAIRIYSLVAPTWNTTTKTLTIAGFIPWINRLVDNLTLTPITNYVSETMELDYAATRSDRTTTVVGPGDIQTVTYTTQTGQRNQIINKQ